jgi:deazaflavin-dependent oxidoreductase (nitroreductase family)
MTAGIESAARAPRSVSIFTPLAKALLAAHVPLGPNALITVAGRKTGLPRTTPVAIIRFDGRRWIWAPWGDVHWVRNLRAAGRATVTVRGRQEEVRAVELDQNERVAFFRDVLGSVARSIPGGMTFIRVVDGVDLNEPDAAAVGRRVFQLHPCSREDVYPSRDDRRRQG